MSMVQLTLSIIDKKEDKMESVNTATQLNAVPTLDEALEKGRRLHDEAIGREIAGIFSRLLGKLAKEDALYGNTLGHAAQ